MSESTPVSNALSGTAQRVLFWLISLVLMAATVASFYFEAQPLLYKSLAWAVLVPLCLLLISLTESGKQGIVFLKETRQEFFKIVWPTRDEAIKTTWVVLALILIMSVIIWVADNLLMRVVQWLIGQ